MEFIFEHSFVLFQMMIPTQVFIIPQYIMVSKLHLTNSVWALAFPGLVSAFGTFLLRQAYMSLPKDLEDAARLDGCSIPQTYCLRSYDCIVCCFPKTIY